MPLMNKVKLFKGTVTELESLEQDINEWLLAGRVKIVSLTGNIAPQTPSSEIGLGTFPSSDILVVVLYEENNG
jgi:hypothetical protein